ncbi:MAG: sulfatase-like hydrolase/transferase [Bacteroidales bacterium]|nr:sulfatase-like hydrolase/transferase [Bacteroidales bacterium]
MKLSLRLLRKLFLLVFVAVIASQTGYSEKKNILFIMVDDFNYWMTGYYPQLKTPNLDTLASRGVLFTQGYCASPVCNPSRNAIWSGYRPSTTQIWQNSNNKEGDFVRDVPGFKDIKTMNQYFTENGYYTFGGGKLYHKGRMSKKDKGTDPDNWSKITEQGSGSPGGPLYKFKQGSAGKIDFAAGNFNINDANDTKLANLFAKEIRDYNTSANKDKPFFMACGFFRPHLPWNCHKDFVEMYNLDSITIPKGYKESDGGNGTNEHNDLIAQGKWKEAIRAYCANSSYADYNVGIVMKALNNSIYKDNTIVVFCGDHGWHLGEKKQWKKSSRWDYANHTTFIIYDPSAKGNGQRCSKVVSLQDIYPTLVELAGLPPKTDIEGMSITPLLEAPGDPNWDNPIYFSYRNAHYIKTNEYKLIKDGEGHLYKTSIDPYEYTNLYKNAQYSDIKKRLEEQLDSALQIGYELKAKLLANYKFTPSIKTIPGTIQAEDYDEGSPEQTYFDTDGTNSGGVYRTGDGVDIQITSDAQGGGYDVTETKDGEWLQYTFQSYTPGIYDITFRVNNPTGSNQKIEYFFDNKSHGFVNIPASGSGYQDIKITDVNLLNGRDFLLFKMKMVEGGFDINQVKFDFITKLPGIKLRNNGSSILQNTIVDNNQLLMDLTYADITVDVTIYNSKGQLVAQDELYGEMMVQYELPSELTSGVYFIQFKDMDGTRSEKFIIR